MTESIAPKSDQLNAEDLLTGPRTFTIAEVKRGTAEQPIDVHLVEFPGRPFKPSKTVRRIMVGAWGPDASTYVGKRMTLYRDATVRFGGQDVGGIRVSHMSDLKKPLTIALTVTRGKRAPFVVQPLADIVMAASSAHLDALRNALATIGITSRAEALAYLSTAVGRTVTNPNELTEDEATDITATVTEKQSTKSAAAPSDALPVEDPPAGWDDTQVREVAP